MSKSSVTGEPEATGAGASGTREAGVAGRVTGAASEAVPSAGSPEPGGGAAAPGGADKPARGAFARARRWRRTRAGARAARRRVYALPGGRTIFKVTVGVLGGLVVALGLVLVPLPGPGWAIVFGGLAIWAIEFAWAARLLHWVRRQVRRFTRMMKRLHWSLRVSLTLVVLTGVAALGWLWIRHRYGVDTITQFWEYILTH